MKSLTTLRRRTRAKSIVSTASVDTITYEHKLQSFQIFLRDEIYDIGWDLSLILMVEPTVMFSYWTRVFYLVKPEVQSYILLMQL